MTDHDDFALFSLPRPKPRRTRLVMHHCLAGVHGDCPGRLDITGLAAEPIRQECSCHCGHPHVAEESWT